MCVSLTRIQEPHFPIYIQAVRMQRVNIVIVCFDNIFSSTKGIKVLSFGKCFFRKKSPYGIHLKTGIISIMCPCVDSVVLTLSYKSGLRDSVTIDLLKYSDLPIFTAKVVSGEVYKTLPVL